MPKAMNFIGLSVYNIITIIAIILLLLTVILLYVCVPNYKGLGLIQCKTKVIFLVYAIYMLIIMYFIKEISRPVYILLNN